MTTLENKINDINDTLSDAHIAKNGKLTLKGAHIVMAFATLIEPTKYYKDMTATSISAVNLRKSHFKLKSGGVAKFRGWKSNAAKYIQLLEELGYIIKSFKHIKNVRVAGFSINTLAIDLALKDTDIWDTLQGSKVHTSASVKPTPKEVAPTLTSTAKCMYKCITTYIKAYIK